MIAISFRFLAGRYHATPWGRHVNEGAVEWPPSPWRILRALMATWKRTLPDLPQEDVEPILRALAAPPEFKLPPASKGHTRHYMPWFKKGPDDRTLVFDTFVTVSRDVPLLVRWPDASLGGAQHATLARILTNLNTLGRSEAWCEGMLLTDSGTETQPNQKEDRQRGFSSVPLNGNDPPADTEIVRLLCADPDSAFNHDKYADSTRKQPKRTTPLYNPDWHLCAETLWLHKERWSGPPGSRWVQYTRPRDCFKIEPDTRPRLRCCDKPRAPVAQVARYAIDSSVLPLTTETLPIAEAPRRTLMGIHGRPTEKHVVCGRSPIFSGKDEHGNPLTGHLHAYYLPTDEDGDGRIDHLTVFARRGFVDSERRTIDRLHLLRTGRRGEDRHPLRLLLLGMGTLEEYHPGPLGKATTWLSATPYIATRHAKTRGRDRIDLSSPQARVVFLIADLRNQLRTALPDLADDAKIEPILEGIAFKVAGR